MKYKSFLVSLCALMLCIPVNAEDNRICSNPDLPCESEQYTFEKYDLSFKLPEKLTWLNTYQSESFYAILLKSVKTTTNKGNCQYVAEPERLEIQAMFPNHKVFASHIGCNDVSPDMIAYTNVNSGYNFLAIYAGHTLKEAKQLLKEIKKKTKFSDLNVRKMQVELYYGD
jgi:hypothetical protein